MKIFKSQKIIKLNPKKINQGFQDENGFLFVMPEAKEIKKYDKTVYSKIMDYVLTKLILLYQSDDVTKSKNEVQFLIDRSAHDWPEIYTLLDGFAPYASHITKIIFISPNRFKTYLSPFAVNSVWNDRFTYFYSFNHAQLKNPKLLASEHIPFVMGGSLTHNWTEYNEHELEIMIYNKSLATHNESFISHVIFHLSILVIGYFLHIQFRTVSQL